MVIIPFLLKVILISHLPNLYRAKTSLSFACCIPETTFVYFPILMLNKVVQNVSVQTIRDHFAEVLSVSKSIRLKMMQKWSEY